MKRATVAAAVMILWAAGCQDDEHFPPGPGEGPGGGSGSGSRIDGGTRADAAADGGGLDGGVALVGVLRDAVDLRDPLGGSQAAPSGITVVVLGTTESAQ